LNESTAFHAKPRLIGLIIYFLGLLDAVWVILVLMGAWYERVGVYESTESAMRLPVLGGQSS
jgi:hypothetical protein